MNIESMGVMEFIIFVFGAIISVLMIIAILKIPSIARCHKATMKLTALMAKKQGVDLEIIRQTVREADNQVFHDKKFEAEIDG